MLDGCGERGETISMKLTYKNVGDNLLFSNGNSIPRVQTKTGWYYNFTDKNKNVSNPIIKNTETQNKIIQKLEINWLKF